MTNSKKIEDFPEFYRDRFAVRQAFDFTARPVDFFDIGNFKPLWIFSKVAPNSRVLDLGCGSGRLACLKAKGCRLTGIDYSASALAIAREINGYDEVFQGDVLNYPGPAETFDHVVSLDVFGHIPFDDKDRVISHLKRLLKPDGSMFHGIECGNIDYTALGVEDWKRIVETDGHVGIENKPALLARFGRFFQHVRGEIRFNLAASVADYIKYGTQFPGQLDPDLVHYLRCMDPFERKAFDICAGLTSIKLEDQQIEADEETEGFLLLEASDRPLATTRMATPRRKPRSGRIDMSDGQIFLSGWYDPEESGGGRFRWARRRAVLKLEHYLQRELRLTLFTRYPLVQEKPMQLYFSNTASGRVLGTVTLTDQNHKSVSIPLEGAVTIIEIFSDIAWVPRSFGFADDHRELSFGIAAIDLA